MQIINIETNTIVFKYDKDSVFDEEILHNAATLFEQLEQKNLTVQCEGFLPVELLMYLSEVSKHCEMIISFDIDKEGEKFLQYLTKQQNSNIIFKDK